MQTLLLVRKYHKIAEKLLSEGLSDRGAEFTKLTNYLKVSILNEVLFIFLNYDVIMSL